MKLGASNVISSGGSGRPFPVECEVSAVPLGRTPVRHGDELTPKKFYQPPEDRRVLSAIALPLPTW